MTKYVLRLADVRISDVALVGGKNASLGEMISKLGPSGIRVPQGFAVTSRGYLALLAQNKLEPLIVRTLAGYRSGQVSLAEAGDVLRDLIANASLPEELEQAIVGAYRDLAKAIGEPKPAVAVRSSATAEDLAQASFAGQQESFLNVVGEEQLLSACRRCYASLFTDRAIAYRQANGIDDLTVALSIGVQQMVRSDIGSSGVMFSLDPDSGFPSVVVINAAWGLGEAIVQGSVEPDKYVVFKPLLDGEDKLPLIECRVEWKRLKVVLDDTGGTRTLGTRVEEREARVLSDADLLQLARWAVLVENHYGRPMDMEWARDGLSGELFLVQARPETVHSSKMSRLVQYSLTRKGKVLAKGQAVGTRSPSARPASLLMPPNSRGSRMVPCWSPGGPIQTGPRC